jgi:hypothetical protein
MGHDAASAMRDYEAIDRPVCNPFMAALTGGSANQKQACRPLTAKDGFDGKRPGDIVA